MQPVSYEWRNFQKYSRPKKYYKIFIALPGCWGKDVWLTRKCGQQLYRFITKGTQIRNKLESRQISTKLRDGLFLYLIQNYSK